MKKKAQTNNATKHYYRNVTNIDNKATLKIKLQTTQYINITNKTTKTTNNTTKAIKKTNSATKHHYSNIKNKTIQQYYQKKHY